MRGLTLADINGDGTDDLIFATNRMLYVYDGNGALLWSKTLQGTAMYPPSVADLNNDGTLEIVQVTGGAPASINPGRIFVLDNQGEDLPGWPKNFTNNWIITGPTLADLDNDSILEILVNERRFASGAAANRLHVLKLDGTDFNSNWPVTFNGNLGVTPSVGDLDNDGEKDIVVATVDALHALNLNGEAKPGWPVQDPNKRFSYQSPLLVDLDSNGTLEIVGTRHGDLPDMYVYEHTGLYRTGWPQLVPDTSWVYTAPTVVDLENDGNYSLFYTKKTSGSNPTGEVLFGFDEAGNTLPDFPFTLTGGNEGFISIADLDDDGDFEIIFPSDLTVDGQGFIQAFHMDGTPVDNFPLRPDGFTFLNGANLGDVNGDGKMNLVALSYNQTFSPTDSTTINVYDLDTPYAPEKVKFGTYKGSNTRDGLVTPPSPVTSLRRAQAAGSVRLVVYPNPLQPQSVVALTSATALDYTLDLYDLTGKHLRRVGAGNAREGTTHVPLSLSDLPGGVYVLLLQSAQGDRQLIRVIR